MTNDEAIKVFQSELRWAELNTYPYISERKVEADKMAIKALTLEQEPKSEWKHDYEILKAYSDGASNILDNIIAEIEQLPTTKCTETHRIYINAYDFKKNVLMILDKYKVEESEE